MSGVRDSPEGVWPAENAPDFARQPRFRSAVLMSSRSLSQHNALSSVDQRIDEEMQALLDYHLPGRSPVSPDDYDWQAIRPDAVGQDILDSLTFVTLVECHPGFPASKLLAAADRGGAPWLRRFIDQTWLPEEKMHHAPYKEYLVRSGTLPREVIDSRIDDVYSRGFVYGEGYTALQAATYGWIQELITWRFYEAMRSHLIAAQRRGDPSDPVLIKVLGDIAKQENFHRHIYLSGAQTILKHAPERKREVVSTLVEFMMPGHHTVPDMQPNAQKWATAVNLSFRTLTHDIVDGVRGLIGYKGLGQTAVLYGSRHPGPWHIKALVKVFKPFARPYGSPANALLGRLIARLV